jgi:hydroxypyruvate reductase
MNFAVRGDLAQVADAAIDAVRPEVLLPRRLAWRSGELLIDGRPFAAPVRPTGRIVVVGGGKAGAGMAAALEKLLPGADLVGLVSVPEGCGRALEHVEVRETRPPGVNLPTVAAVAVTREMRRLLASLGPDDLAVVIVTGGGSALLEEPAAGVSLDDVLAVTRALAAAGADIRELNAVRQSLSVAKAGGLARACTAGRLVTVVLSDVIGDPLDLIASGPCMPVTSDPRAALAILDRYHVTAVASAVARHLAGSAASPPPVDPRGRSGEWTTPAGCRVSHVLLGSNATAVDAAAKRAAALGYDVTMRQATAIRETANEVGRRLASETSGLATAVARDGRPRAVIEGGEAVVAVPDDHGSGGRNQQTVLVAADAWLRSGRPWPEGVGLASIGTDGEDGPTDAAGGLVDREVVERLAASGIDLPRGIARCDAQPALAAAGGLVVTGPTGTNVADVRIMLARP